MVSLKDMVPSAQTNINAQFILLAKGRTAMEGQKKTHLALVADETSAPGDIIHLTNGIFSYNRNNFRKWGEFTMAFVETPNMSEIRWAPNPNNSKKYVCKALIFTHSHIFPLLA
ncbi:hypothetical protein P3X46_022109 [Hevea brasiliensis]|uniref:Uncharacterized protein n=1 Tax=Hevea brasiliensis TaxID=3981 RepID=A0ABQ9LJJ3_HEVBR|nr:hypothetical protein P3X46_022109 [Hevea brasiliensis]